MSTDFKSEYHTDAQAYLPVPNVHVVPQVDLQRHALPQMFSNVQRNAHVIRHLPTGTELLKNIDMLQHVHVPINKHVQPAAAVIKQSSDSLSGEQMAKLKSEFKMFEGFCKFTDIHNVDYSNLEDVIHALTFQNLCDNVQKHCPLLQEILEIFVQHSEERKIKTGAEKLLRAVHAHGCLLKIGNQVSTSFPLFFGILLISFGCGQGIY
jgi:hypothetical protein